MEASNFQQHVGNAIKAIKRNAMSNPPDTEPAILMPPKQYRSWGRLFVISNELTGLI